MKAVSHNAVLVLILCVLLAVIGFQMDNEIIVNTDASIRIVPDGLKRLVRAFQNPEVGLASGEAALSPWKPEE